MVLVLLMAVIGYAGSSATVSLVAPAEGYDFPQFMVMGGGQTGGVLYGAANTMAQMLTDNTPMNVTVQATTGGGQNVLLLHQRETDIALIDNFTLYQASLGTGAFSGGKISDLRAIGKTYQLYFQQAVRVDSGINSIEEFAGKSLVVGPPGSATELWSRAVYDAYGYDYTDRKDFTPNYVSAGEGVEKIQNRLVDGMNCGSPLPYNAYVELFMIDAIKLLPLNDDAITKLTTGGMPFMPAVIPAGTYKGQDEDIKTFADSLTFTCHADMPEELVYELTKTFCEKMDYLIANNNAFAPITPEAAPVGNFIPLHPGAERYYREVGLLK